MTNTAPAAITSKSTPELFDTIAVGDRVETWDGVWGTLTAVEFHSQTVWNGSEVIFEATLTIESDNLPTYDRLGTPRRYSGTIVRRVRKHFGDLRWAYTPDPAAAREAAHRALYARLSAAGHNVALWRDDPSGLAAYARAVETNARADAPLTH